MRGGGWVIWEGEGGGGGGGGGMNISAGSPVSAFGRSVDEHRFLFLDRCWRH